MVSLGDIVGYGASPNECCDLVRSDAEVTILGNHDAAVAGRMDYSFYYDAARHALDCSAERAHRREPGVAAQPAVQVRMGDIGFCHGSPVDPRGVRVHLRARAGAGAAPYVPRTWPT